MTIKRFEYVDLVKTVAIFLIVIAHFLPNNSFLRIMIYSFHVPIFFFISGIIHEKIKIKKLINRILVLYLIYYIMSVLILVIFGTPTQNDLLDILYINGEIGLWNSVLWFFPCYFLTLCLFLIVKKIMKDKIWISLVICTLLSILLFYSKKLNLFGFNKVILLYSYFCLGYILKKFFLKLYLRKNFKYSIISFLLFLILVITYYFINKNNPISINQNDINNVFVYMLFSSLECFSLTISCMTFSKSETIVLISKNTLFIMSTHLIFRLFLQKVIILSEKSLIYYLFGPFTFVIEVLIIILLKKVISNFKKNTCLNYFGLNLS